MEEFSWADEVLVNVAGNVDRFGNAVVYVGGECAIPGCDGDHPSDLDALALPPYGYTVGLPERYGHAELVMIGERASTALILNRLACVVAHGARFEPGDEIGFGDTRLKVSRCAPSWVREGIVAMSFGYHEFVGHRQIPSPLQIMWPDSEGRWPDDPACDRAMRRAQPWLGRARPKDRRRGRAHGRSAARE